MQCSPPRPAPSEISSRLAEQILAAQLELLRGFQADEATCRGLPPGDIHDGLRTVLLRLVFLLHAEDHDLMPSASDHTVTGLHQRLRDDAGRHPHTLDQRFDAWPALLSLFRLVHAARKGRLFDPDRHPFLEGRTRDESWQSDARREAPRVPDGALWRVLEALLVQGGERIAYRSLDIEHIGSVHEAMMGFELECADGSLHLRRGEERRNSGAHYTPRGLTGPLVRTALRPLLEALGERPTPAQILDIKLCDPAMGSGAFLVEAAHQLGEQLRRAWDHHRVVPPMPPDADPELHARRLVARHCLHGVDKDPVAVDLARLSLWLVTRAKDHPFTFLDHALKHGDSLVGVDKSQLPEFRTAHEARLLGDALIHAHFSAGDSPVIPFHWPIEFPEVFDRANPGFDCFVGNPPFLGGTRLSTVSGMAYFAWLLRRNPGTHHLCDLVAHFLRIAFALLRQSGTLGFVATNTVAQGDTRIGGLAWISAHGGVIYAAERRVRWPGSAAVVVSIVHIRKGATTTRRTLDGRPVAHISSYLVDSATDSTPKRLPGAAERFSLGSKIYGQGFLFADDDPAATPLATLETLLARNPRLQARIFPYIGGLEVNQSPTQAPARHAIYLSDLDTEAELQAWPELAAIVRARVKPERDRLGANPNNTPLRRRWWAYQAHRPGLYAAVRGLERVLVLSRVSRSFAFTFLPPTYIYSEQLVAFTFDTFSAFTILQSRVHEVWARFFSSSMKDDLRYTPSDCFETFPFPRDWQHDPALEWTGKRYYERRADLMLRNNEGLTTTYNRFHDPGERAPEILRLRELHAAMDRAVLSAYGWTDLAERATCEFRLDYADDDNPAKKKPWRHRWPQDLHDAVLARLLDLNHQRAAEDHLPGGAD